MFLKKAEKLFKDAEKHQKEYKKPNDFSHLATRILENSNIHESFDDDVIHKIFSLKTLPKQNYGLNNFSDTPFTLFRNDRFFLDIYFWRLSDTDIHSHHFTGAFKMLKGSQQQLELGFKKNKTLYPFLEQGTIKVKSNKSILVGETQSILLGNDFIHQTFHDATKLTVNLCLRTILVPGHNLYSFLLNGYSLKNSPYQEVRLRKMSLVRTLPEAQQRKAMMALLETLDLLTLINIFKGDHFSHAYLNEDFRELTKICIKRQFPKDYAKLRGFFKDLPKHQEIHRKLKFFTNH
jgi:hypothetical protein